MEDRDWRIHRNSEPASLSQVSVNKDPVSSKVDIEGLTPEVYTHSDIYAF